MASYCELKPMLLGDNTEVKLPVNLDESVGSESPMINMNRDGLQDDELSELQSYNFLLDFFKQLPCYMFINIRKVKAL